MRWGPADFRHGFLLVAWAAVLCPPRQTRRTVAGFFLDFEATGVDPKFDRVVEFAAIACVGPPGTPPPSFSTVICIDALFLQEHGAKAGEIHGIPPEELARGRPRGTRRHQ